MIPSWTEVCVRETNIGCEDHDLVGKGAAGHQRGETQALELNRINCGRLSNAAKTMDEQYI